MTTRPRAVVSGAPGFVGANLARRLLLDGHETVLLCRPGCDRWRLAGLEDDARILEVDLTDQTSVRAAMASIRPDWVFHLAAHGAYSWQRDLERMVAVNLNGTANLLRASLDSGCSAFINTGSSSEYGLKDHAPGEDEPVAPNSDYAVTKLAATLHCQMVARAEGLKVTTLRLYSVYGPFEEPQRLVPALLVCGLDGRLPSLADPRTARDYVWVGDVVDAYLAAASSEMAKPGAVYNVGTGRQTTLGEAIAIARRVLDLAANPEWGAYPSRQWDTAVWVADPRRIAAELGWRAAIDFESGFRATLDWLGDHPSLLDLYRARIHAG